MAVSVDEKVFTGEQFHVDSDLEGRDLFLRLNIGHILVYDIAAILPAVQARIDSGKKPAGVLSKSVERIAHYTEQLENAVKDLFECYGRMSGIAPKRRTSTAYKARYALLDSMSLKALKVCAEDFIPDEVADYILSDPTERQALIERLCAILVDDGKEKATEQVGSEE